MGKVTKLKQYTNDIIIYLKQNQFDGTKLIQMKRKEFINQLSMHLNDKKLAAKLGILRKNMMAFDLTKYVEPKVNEPKEEELKHQNDKRKDDLKKIKTKQKLIIIHLVHNLNMRQTLRIHFLLSQSM